MLFSSGVTGFNVRGLVLSVWCLHLYVSCTTLATSFRREARHGYVGYSGSSRQGFCP